jgi:hypothetical protein
MKYECRKCVGEDTDSEGNCILDVGSSEDVPSTCPFGQPFVDWKLIEQLKEEYETDGEQTVKNSV